MEAGGAAKEHGLRSWGARVEEGDADAAGRWTSTSASTSPPAGVGRARAKARQAANGQRPKAIRPGRRRQQSPSREPALLPDDDAAAAALNRTPRRSACRSSAPHQRPRTAARARISACRPMRGRRCTQALTGCPPLRRRSPAGPASAYQIATAPRGGTSKYLQVAALLSPRTRERYLRQRRQGSMPHTSLDKPLVSPLAPDLCASTTRRALSLPLLRSSWHAYLGAAPASGDPQHFQSSLGSSRPPARVPLPRHSAYRRPPVILLFFPSFKLQSVCYSTTAEIACCKQCGASRRLALYRAADGRDPLIPALAARRVGC